MTSSTPSHHRNVSEAYRISSYHGLSQREAMAEVLRTLISHLYMARDAYSEGKFDVMFDYNSKTLRILAILRDTIHASGALRDEEAAPHAQALSSQYNQAFGRLTNILRAPDVVSEYESLVALLKPLYHVWERSTHSPAFTPLPGDMLL